MRENSGKGKSNTGLLDPTLKEHEAERGKSGAAILKTGKGSKGAKRTSPEGGVPEKS